ncbi:MAG: N-succinyldiaminopimelate aminotransferase [Paracoccaceae bacterium]|jgi:N-succinyldiaminopimelate aminotransferase
MTFPERFSNLPEYAFPRLRHLLHGMAPGGPEIDMTIGEPRHAMPPFVAQVFNDAISGFAKYPANDGTPDLLAAIGDWIETRFGVTLDPTQQVMALNGTREGLYNACMALCPEVTRGGARPVVLTPNPFYQVYAVAGASVGAEVVFVPATAQTDFLPDYASLPEDILNRTEIVYLCSPSNPQGAVADAEYWANLLAMAEKYDFRIFSDECYSEIYRDSPPPGGLQMVQAFGADPERVVVFHSLSKRSNLPGLRSGFVAGGPQSIARIRQLRAFAGAPLPLPTQAVSAAVWRDEEHVRASLALYQQKYAIADTVFSGMQGYQGPRAGFFLWLPVPDGEAATIKLLRDTGVKVLPGAYLSRDVGGNNPGTGYIRVALVANLEETTRGLTALRECLYT